MKDITAALTVGESVAEHQRDILIACKGWLKFSPTIGVCIRDYQDDESDSGALRYEIRQNFAADGMDVQNVAIIGENIEIHADY